MAFEAYLQQDQVRSSRGRRMMYMFSAAAHALAVLSAVAYSFWHVEELSPPTVTVTFMSAAAAPPPPPPPPPLGSGAAPSAVKHRVSVRPKVEVPKTAELVQPKEREKKPAEHTPEEAPKEPAAQQAESSKGAADNAGATAGVKAGVTGGVSAGAVGGTVGGKGVGTQSPLAPKFLPPLIGAQQRISGPEPEFPTHLRTAGANYVVMAKVCVSTTGAVDSVTLLKRAHPTLDNNEVMALRKWTFRPLMVNGTPAPFCYFVRHEFKTQ